MIDWRNLVFSPLDLPDPPEVDTDKFLAWHSDQKEYMLLHNQNRINSTKLYGGYCWHVSWAKWYTTYNTKQPWICDFDKRFPELVEYLELFPFKQTKSISFLNQIGGATVEPHTDPDELWGMRFYLKNKNKDALYFSRTKEISDHQMRTMEDSNGNPLTEKRNYLDYCKDEKLYARFPKEQCAWMLNSNRAWHGVDKNSTPTGSRITCTIMGEYDKDKLFKLLEKSTQKHKEYQIWY
jgi:hypothetical protein